MANEEFACGSRTLLVGASSSQGNVEYKALNFDGATSFFGLYDGEEGSVVPRFCGNYLHKEIKRIEDLLKTQKEEKHDEEEDDAEDLCAAIKDGFLRMDDMMKDESLWTELHEEGISSERKEQLKDSLDLTGSQACVVLVRNNSLIVASVGLSSCIMSRKDDIFELTTQHRPDMPVERKRINAAGGIVSRRGEVRQSRKSADSLDFSRAIGYMSFKQNDDLSPTMQIVIAKPVVRMVELRQDIELIILAPRIFWISMKKEAVLENATAWIKGGHPLSEVCEKLRTLCLTKCPPGESTLNMKVIIIQLEVLESQVPMLESQVPEEESNKIFKQRCVKDPEKWNRLSETYVLSRDREPDEMLERLRVANLRSVENGNDDGPSYIFPSRADYLYGYNPELGQVCLRRGKTYSCRSVEKNKQIAAISKIAEDLLKRKDNDSVRGVSYRVENVCDHNQSDKALKELCLLTESTRSSLNVLGTPTGSICGPIVLNANGTKIDCEGGGLSCMKIPTDAEKGVGITGIEPKGPLKYILLLEKETTFLVLRDLNFQTNNQCVLITGGGMPDVATRIVVRKLKEYLKVPVYCFVDANPFGIQIYTTYRFGSKELAFDNSGLTVSTMKLVGFSPEDIVKVHRSSRKVLSDNDMTCLQSLLATNYVMKDKTLKHHLKFMEKNPYKAQIEGLQESLGNAGLAEYIKEKIAQVHQAK